MTWRPRVRRRQALTGQEKWEESIAARTIKGHPSIEAVNNQGQTITINLCANCGAVRRVLYLSTDRWFCTACRNTGDARPTQVAIPNPARRQ